MNFAELSWLYSLVILVPLFLGLIFLAQKAYNQRLDRVVAQANRRFVLKPPAKSLAVFSTLLKILALICIMIALARPRWDFKWQTVSRSGLDIMIALDLSQSMLASDVKPNRLEQAKRSIQDLLKTSSGDRIGLVVFAGVAFIQCPLTYDKTSVQLFLDQASPELLPTQGTALGAAIDLAKKALKGGTESSSRGKTIILVSDGEDFGEEAGQSARTLKEQGITLYTVSMGKEGAPVPTADGGFLRDAGGQMVISKPNRQALAQLAELGGGRLISSMALDSFYQKSLALADKSEGLETREKLWEERHFWFSLMAIALLVLELWQQRRAVF